jgi:N-terminal domain of anti-restriction factor ArdC
VRARFKGKPSAHRQAGPLRLKAKFRKRLSPVAFASASRPPITAAREAKENAMSSHRDGERRDIYSEITSQLIAAIETNPGKPVLPWRRSSGPLFRPVNALTQNAYNGINIVSLWVAAEVRQYAAPVWATYRQWSELGAQVRKSAARARRMVRCRYGASARDMRVRIEMDGMFGIDANYMSWPGFREPNQAARLESKVRSCKTPPLRRLLAQEVSTRHS